VRGVLSSSAHRAGGWEAQHGQERGSGANSAIAGRARTPERFSPREQAVFAASLMFFAGVEYSGHHYLTLFSYPDDVPCT